MLSDNEINAGPHQLAVMFSLLVGRSIFSRRAADPRVRFMETYSFNQLKYVHRKQISSGHKYTELWAEFETLTRAMFCQGTKSDRYLSLDPVLFDIKKTVQMLLDVVPSSDWLPALQTPTSVP